MNHFLGLRKVRPLTSAMGWWVRVIERQRANPPKSQEMAPPQPRFRLAWAIPFQDPLSKNPKVTVPDEWVFIPPPLYGFFASGQITGGKTPPPPCGHWSVLTNIIIIPLSAPNPNLIDLITCPLGIQIRDGVIG